MAVSYTHLGPAADFIHQHQAVFGGIMQNIGGFGHFYHEGGTAACQVDVYKRQQHYDTAAAITCSILRALSREPLRTGRILNINCLLYTSLRSGDSADGCAQRRARSDSPS